MNKEKKITAKEFKEILNKAEIDFNIYGYGGILNLISLAYEYISEDEKRNNRDSLAKLYKERSKSIYASLNEIGYYKD